MNCASKELIQSVMEDLRVERENRLPARIGPFVAHASLLDFRSARTKPTGGLPTKAQGKKPAPRGPINFPYQNGICVARFFPANRPWPRRAPGTPRFRRAAEQFPLSSERMIC